MKSTVLVVEDDAAIRRGLVDALEFGGYRVLETGHGKEGLDLAVEADPDLVLLDVVLPGMDGFSILDEIRRARPRLPVIMVTARGAEPDCVRGLRGGADDYVVKPFSASELLARVEAVLRRSAERPSDIQQIRADGRTVELARQEVRLDDGSSRPLSPREGEILRYLAACRGRPVNRREILHRVWGLNPRGIETRTVDMHIARLREKIGDNDADVRFIRTVRGQGYMLDPDVQCEPEGDHA